MTQTSKHRRWGWLVGRWTFKGQPAPVLDMPLADGYFDVPQVPHPKAPDPRSADLALGAVIPRAATAYGASDTRWITPRILLTLWKARGLPVPGAPRFSALASAQEHRHIGCALG